MSPIQYSPIAQGRKELAAMRAMLKPQPITAGMRVNAAFACLADAWGERKVIDTSRVVRK